MVSWRWSVPSAAIDQTSLPGSSPAGPRSNAMRRPSGDQEGEESNTALSVIADTAPPSARATAISTSSAGLGCVVKARRVPSGESDG